jgi:hypothetical protein
VEVHGVGRGANKKPRVVWMPIYPPGPLARPLRPLDLHADMTKKYSSIFEVF